MCELTRPLSRVRSEGSKAMIRHRPPEPADDKGEASDMQKPTKPRRPVLPSSQRRALASARRREQPSLFQDDQAPATSRTDDG